METLKKPQLRLLVYLRYVMIALIMDYSIEAIKTAILYGIQR